MRNKKAPSTLLQDCGAFIFIDPSFDHLVKIGDISTCIWN